MLLITSTTAGLVQQNTVRSQDGRQYDDWQFKLYRSSDDTDRADNIILGLGLRVRSRKTFCLVSHFDSFSQSFNGGPKALWLDSGQ